MISKRPHDQRVWETDEWESGWTEMTQMLLLYISAHLYVVFLKDERALEYLYLVSVACVSGVQNPIWYICVYLYTSMCEYCISLCICIPHVPLKDCWPLCVCACVCLCASCVDTGCTVDSALSDFVSGFLTHVLMAIKDFSLFGIHFFLNSLFFLI